MTRVAVLAFLTAVIVPLWPHAGLAQTGGEVQTLKKEIEALKEGQTAIQKDLQEIKKLLQTRQAPAAPAEFKEAIINIDNAPVKGDKNARLVLMEFSDYQ